MSTYENGEKPSGETEKDDDILELARKQYRMCQEAEGNRADALDDLRFLQGGENQWDPRAYAQRQADGRPTITVNDLPSFLHQVTNDQRMNRPSIKVHPVDSNTDPKTARVVQGMIRHIEYDSNADVAYDRSVNSAAAIGFGYWFLDTEYESPKSFNQKIVYRSIRNHLAVHIDPVSTEADGSDMGFAFIDFLMDRKDFEREYPKANASNSQVFQGNSDYSGWLSDNTVLVCRYYCIKKTKATAVLLSNGEEGFKEDLVEMPVGVTIIKERPSERRRVMCYKITGVDILEKTEIKCDWIPVFPVYGDEIDIEGKVFRAGLIRNAKGPCQAYNVMMSGATEEISLRSKAPFIGAEGQFEGHEDDWAQANNRAFPYLEYKATTVDGKLVPAPQRQQMADVPSGMIAMALHAQDNKKKTTGLFDSSLGARGNAQSGVQERAQQQQGDMANFHYLDGLLRTIRHCGRCLMSMIPHYYDKQRIVRVLGEDDEASYEEINVQQQQQGQFGPVDTVLNDLTVGKFDITVSSGPSFSTMRQEAAEAMAGNMEKNPGLWNIIGDLYVRNQDWPGAEKMSERLKKTIPPEILAADETSDDPNDPANAVVQTPHGPLPLAQVPQALAGLEQQLIQAQQAMQKAQADKQAAEVMKQQNEGKSLQIQEMEARIKEREAQTNAFEAETARQAMEWQKQVDLAKAQADGEKERTEQMRCAAESEQKQMESQSKEQEAASTPTIEDMAQLIIASRPSINGMTISAPSGQNYEVQIKQ